MVCRRVSRYLATLPHTSSTFSLHCWSCLRSDSISSLLVLTENYNNSSVYNSSAKQQKHTWQTSTLPQWVLNTFTGINPISPSTARQWSIICLILIIPKGLLCQELLDCLLLDAHQNETHDWSLLSISTSFSFFLCNGREKKSII